MGDLARIEGFCELSTTNLTFKRDVSKEEWMDVFKALKQVEGCVQFWIGDCLAYRQQKWGMYDDIAEETGYETKALRNIKYVADNVELSRRKDNLSFSHHVEVASLPPSGSTRSTRTEQPLKEAPRYQKRTSGRCPSQRRRAQQKSHLLLRNNELSFNHHKEVASLPPSGSIRSTRTE